MEVILLENVKNVGKKDEIVKVSDGYARNFIIKKKLGVEATKENRQDLDIRLEEARKDAALLLAEAKSQKEDIEKISIAIPIKTGEGGRTFGSVSSKEIGEELEKQHNIVIDKRKITMEPIKELGGHEVQIKLHPEVTATLKVKVVEGK